MPVKYLKCSACGNIVSVVKDVGVPIMCCGQRMEELLAGVTDAAAEKHVPKIKAEGKKVTVDVGSVVHPMLEEHYITWITLETKEGVQRKELSSGMAPRAEFCLSDSDEPVAVYAYCNLHGLWRADIDQDGR